MWDGEVDDRLWGMMRTTLLVTMALAIALPAFAQQVGSAPLFASEEAIELTLSADFSLLKDDRHASPERPATVTVTTAAGGNVTIEAQLRTRGRFRLEKRNCSFPPLRLNFRKKQTEGTEFEGQDKLKIVSPCRPNRDSYEQLVLNEYLAYRTFAMITATSLDVRLARITYVDESGDDDPFTRLAFFIEDAAALAARVGVHFEVFDIPEGKNLPHSVFEPTTTQTMAIFQYMIGNTDWSEVAGHNVEVLGIGGVALPVPYDFDFSGIVEAPYAVPGRSLSIKTVQDRLYRGWCRGNLDPEPILELFRAAETDIMALYRDFPSLEEGERNRSVRYLEGFFEDIASPQRADRRFLRHCLQLPT